MLHVYNHSIRLEEGGSCCVVSGLLLSPKSLRRKSLRREGRGECYKGGIRVVHCLERGDDLK